MILFCFFSWFLGVPKSFALKATTTTTTTNTIPRSTSIIIAKTTETFKLGELQYLEATIQAQLRNITCKRLLVDQQTGSTILLLQHYNYNTALNNNDKDTPFLSNYYYNFDTLPSSLKRCDWIGTVLVQGKNVIEFVDNLSKLQSVLQSEIETGWVLDYKKFFMSHHDKDNQDNSAQMIINQQQKQKEMKYTMKSILCIVSQIIPTMPSLDPKMGTTRLLILDTQSCGMYLLKLYHGTTTYNNNNNIINKKDNNDNKIIKKQWYNRPFQYSSAINPTVAEMVIDLLWEMVIANNKQENTKSISNHDSKQHGYCLLDPTCGSGTFLMFAIAKGFQQVHGYDSNPSCGAGSISNLKYMFGAETVNNSVSIHTKDCRIALQDHQTFFNCNNLENNETTIDCVVANLPWGLNTRQYENENNQILRQLHKRLPQDCPCVFVTRETMQFEKLGYTIIGQAHIPPKAFILPKSKKTIPNNESTTSTRSQERNNICVVTVVKTTSINTNTF